MDTKFTIKNFRVFDEEGVSFDLNPLTILTGCNSSGKSSIVKALLLLNDYLSQIKKAIDKGDWVELADYKIDFYKYPINLLGRFDKTIHEGSDNRQITMEYVTYSRMISKDVTVQLVFTADDNDGLNNAYLHKIVISSEDGVIYASDRENPVVCNLYLIKDAFLEFLPVEFVIHNYCGLESRHKFGWYDGNEIPEVEYESQKKQMLSYLNKCDEKRKIDVLKYIRTSKVNDSFVGRHQINPEILEWSIQSRSLFRIPIIDRLDGIAKDSIIDFVDQEFLQNKSKEEVFASHKILNDFIGSDCDTFGDYFKQFENQYLKQINEYHEGLHMFHENGLSLFGWNINVEEQHYLLYKVYDEPIRRIGKIGKSESVEEKNLRHSKEIQDWETRQVSFGMVYEVVMGWNYTAGSEGEKVYYDIKMRGYKEYEHRMLSVLDDFAKLFIHEVICPDWCGTFEYVSSSRAEVKRLYTLDTKDQFSELLKRYFEAKRKLGPDDARVHSLLCNPYSINSFINKWIKRFGIGDSISAEPVSDGTGITIWINKDNGKKSLLADEGFGITQLVSILLQMETVILSAKGVEINRFEGLKNLDGYDEHWQFQYEINTIAIEEPEIHLHPKYQSMLADMLVEAYKKYNVHFIVETHSEYLIRKLQVLVAGKGNEEDLQISKDDISILYVNSPKVVEETGEPQVKQIRIQEDGRLDSPFGTGFFDEADNQAMELLRIKAIGK